MRSWITLMMVVATTIMAPRTVAGAEFNPQVMARVTERVEEFMTVPLEIVRRASMYQFSGGFPNDLRSFDRDLTYRWLRMEDPVSFFYGLEDGTFLNYNDHFTSVSYREPGESGYSASEVPKDMMKHWIACIDRYDGSYQSCQMEEGSLYVQCVDKCSLVKCPDETSQRNCSALPSAEAQLECEQNIKWCPNYNISTVAAGEALGFVPRTYHCVDPQGQQEQTLGKVYKGGDIHAASSLGNCYFEDGVTLVERNLIGNYAYCGGTGVPCKPFVGGFRSRDYDPRVRGWYSLAKETQQPVWSPPYPFYTNLQMGITYSAPIYSTSSSSLGSGKKVFHGVFAVDYALSFISEFLSEQFSVQSSDIMVVIVEAAAPHYMIAASTGSNTSVKVLKENVTQPCLDDTSSDCAVVRIPVDEFEATREDFILQRAFQAQAAAGHPMGQLIPFKESDDIGSNAFVSQGDVYEQEGANMRWHVIVVMPMSRSTTDEVLPESSTFVILCLFASLGFITCFGLFLAFLSYRQERAVRYADWRFTGAFIFFCSILNLSSFTLLGTNTNEICMARMWLFNALFACALSPLFVKVWRMYQLVTASKGFKRVNISHYQAFLYCLPICIVQILILTIFSFVDPPRVEEELGVGGGFGMQRISCEQESRAFFYTQVVYDGILVLIGCVLAIKTRNLDKKFGEAKQLAFAMYNIAFTGVVIIVVLTFANMEQNAKAAIHAAGLCWGTVFSCFAFVLPRLLAVMEEHNKSNRNTAHGSKHFTVKSGNEVLISKTMSQRPSTDEFGVSPPPTPTPANGFVVGTMIRNLNEEVQQNQDDSLEVDMPKHEEKEETDVSEKRITFAEDV